MAHGETENHRRLKALTGAWARANGFAIAACEVRVPKSGYRADVAAYAPKRRGWTGGTREGGDVRTAVFECKQARADLLKDARREEEARTKVAELGERLKKLEELIGGHRPDLRKGESLFPEFDAWDFSGLEHVTHRKVVAELAKWQERLLSGTKFAKLWRWRAADFFYLVSEEGIFAEAEVPAGWGLLVRERGVRVKTSERAGAGERAEAGESEETEAGEGKGEERETLRLVRPPVWAEAAEAQRLALLEGIAIAATRAVWREAEGRR